MALFKYVPSEFNLERPGGVTRLLQTRKVRFTQPGDFNDPFEMKPYFTGLANRPYLESEINRRLPQDIERFHQTLPEETQRQWPLQRLLHFAMKFRSQFLKVLDTWSRQATPARARNLDDHINEKLGVFCLSECSDNILMWSHYAEGHKGSVVRFDDSHHWFNRRGGEDDSWRHAVKVNYSSNRPTSTVRDVDLAKLYLTKSREWRYEQEHRMICPLEEADDIVSANPYSIHLFSIPPQAITGIIFGCQITDTEREYLSQLIGTDQRLSHVSLYQAAPHESEFGLVINEYK